MRYLITITAIMMLLLLGLAPADSQVQEQPSVTYEGIYIPNNIYDWTRQLRKIIIANRWELGNKYPDYRGTNYRFQLCNHVRSETGELELDDQGNPIRNDRIAVIFTVSSGHPHHDAYSVLNIGNFVEFTQASDVVETKMSYQVRPNKVNNHTFTEFDDRTIAAMMFLPMFQSIETRGRFPDASKPKMWILLTTFLPYSGETFVVELNVGRDHTNYHGFLRAYWNDPSYYQYSPKPLSKLPGIARYLSPEDQLRGNPTEKFFQ